MPLSRITAASIADGTIVAADIADGSVTGPKLGATSINANNIVAGAVTGDKLGATSVNANNIVDGVITSAKLSSNISTSGTSEIRGSGSQSAELRIYENSGNGTQFTAIKAANTISSNVTFTLPSADGTSGQVVQTNGSGTLSFANVGVANGGTGATTLTANNVILGNGTSAVQFVAPGTSSNVLTSSGNTWISQAISAGGLTEIGSLTLGNNSGTINLPSSWNTTYKYLVLIFDGVATVPGGETSGFYIRFNSDTGNNYSYSWIASGFNTAQSSQPVISSPIISNNDGVSAFLQMQYFPNESTSYRMRIAGSVNISNRTYAYGAAFGTTSAPSTFNWVQYGGAGRYLTGALKIYGAS